MSPSPKAKTHRRRQMKHVIAKMQRENKLIIGRAGLVREIKKQSLAFMPEGAIRYASGALVLMREALESALLRDLRAAVKISRHHLARKISTAKALTLMEEAALTPEKREKRKKAAQKRLPTLRVADYETALSLRGV